MPPNQPQSPSPQYDFILKGDQKPKSSFSLSGLKLPKPVVIILAIIVGLIVLIIVYSLFFGGKGGKYDDIVDLVNRQQEIIRVTNAAQTNLKDPAAIALATTTKSTITSEQNQLISYLQTKGTKVDPAKLTKYLNSSTDTALAAAYQNNSGDGTYETYIKSSLGSYQAALSQAYKSAPASAKPLLSGYYTSTGVLLANPPLSN